LLPSSASAVSTRAQLGFSPITGSGTGVTLHYPSGIAVDETSGNVFLNDGGGGNVTDIFGAEGGVPSGVASPYQISGFAFAEEPSGAAVDNSATSPSKGALYVVDVRHNAVKKFIRSGGTELYEAAGELTPSFGPAFSEPLGAAVDSKGNVFIADYGSRSVVEFGPTGTQMARIDISDSVNRPSSLALDSAGDLFVQSYTDGSVYKYPVNASGEVETGVFTQVVASGATGVAVDLGANLLFVGLGDRVNQYDAATLAQQIEFGAGVLGRTARIAVNSSTQRIYVSDTGVGKDVVVFGAEIKFPGVTADATTSITGTKATLNATVNPDGLAVTECKFEYGTTSAYGSSKPCEGAIPPDSSDHPVTAALTGLVPGSTYHFRILVTNANGTNQSSDQTFETPQLAFTEDATAVTGAGATLNGAVNPDGLAVTECKFEYGTSMSYGSTVTCAESSGAIGTGTSPVPVHAALSSLAPGTTYHFRLVVANAEGTAQGSDLTFTTFGPLISVQSVEAVGVTDVTVSAKVNPKGEKTTYHVEYGTTASYGQSTAESFPIGFEGDESSHTVSVHIGGLIPGTAYHFRFVATNPSGNIRGLDTAFATYPSSPSSLGSCPNDQFRTGFGARLPDCRAYEQATPIDKHGANAKGERGMIQASSAGDRVTFFTAGGLPTTGGSKNLYPFIASRDSDGWSADGLLPLADPGFSTPLIGLNDDLSAAAVVGPGPENIGGAVYLRDSHTATFQLGLIGPNRLFSSPPHLGGFAADANHLILQTDFALLPSAPPDKSNLYDLDHGVLTLAGRIPSAPATSCNDEVGPACTIAAEGSFAGPYDWVDSNTNQFGGGEGGYYTQNTISRDGSKVFFTAAGSGQLYVREDGIATIQVSASQRTTPDPNGEKPAAFLAATPDGSKVFFASCEKLTDDSTAVSTGENSCSSASEGQDLYSFDTDSGELTDLTVDSNIGDSKGAAVQGILGTSDDGSYVYFAANGVLAPGAAPGDCAINVETLSDTCNLYVSHEGMISFILQAKNVSSRQMENWTPRTHTTDSRARTSRVSADGRTLIFSSDQSLAGYDNTGVNGCGSQEFNPCKELFRYSAPEGEVSCVSCNATGTRPNGDAVLGVEGGINLHGILNFTSLTRNLSADGNRVFFESPDALLSTDTNGVKDIYEWEAKGSGSCGTEGGCISLISSGTSPDPSWFADASTDGNHVFFFTSQQLVPSDKDQLYDVYDAGVAAGLPSQHVLAPPTCTSTACQVNPAPPPEQTAASAVFSGPGNAHRRSSAHKCPKGKRRARHAGKVRCQKASKQHRRPTNRGGSK
jgi:hypothetical protein